MNTTFYKLIVLTLLGLALLRCAAYTVAYIAYDLDTRQRMNGVKRATNERNRGLLDEEEYTERLKKAWR